MNIRELFPAPFDHSSIPEFQETQYLQAGWCEDIPENRKRFLRLKYLIVSGIATQAHAPSEKQLKQAWKDLHRNPP